MRGSQNLDVTNDGTTANVSTIHSKGALPWEFTGCSGLTADDRIGLVSERFYKAVQIFVKQLLFNIYSET